MHIPYAETPRTQSLKDRIEVFCLNYVKLLDQTRAARAAGYTGPGAKVRACHLMARPDVKARIAELMAERSERTKIDADWVLKEAVDLYTKTAKTLGDKPTAGMVTAAKGVLEIIGKHVDVGAFKERMELTGKNGGPIETSSKTLDLTKLTSEELRLMENMLGKCGNDDAAPRDTGD